MITGHHPKKSIYTLLAGLWQPNDAIHVYLLTVCSDFRFVLSYGHTFVQLAIECKNLAMVILNEPYSIEAVSYESPSFRNWKITHVKRIFHEKINSALRSKLHHMIVNHAFNVSKN